jgi:hypothetical protein
LAGIRRLTSIIVPTIPPRRCAIRDDATGDQGREDRYWDEIELFYRFHDQERC